ncbi:MAG TPA: glycosyltransferase family 4 protein [Vicinamibacterales bacterium]|nr:glycosyltransferase family 4 protein [Vicinamibacterales bacterium]
MKVAQVAPLYESVPPKLYGGTERVVSYLTEELIGLGHEVTLFASGDSVTSAKLVPAHATSLRLDPACRDPLSPHVLMIEQLARTASSFDIIHFHIAPLHFPVVRRLPGIPHVTTLHGRLDMPELVDLYREFGDIPVVSISDAQRRPLPEAGWIGTVHHGLPFSLLPYHPSPANYLAFLGRISPEKRVDRAIAIAIATGIPLRIAAKVDPVDREYFECRIRPLLDHPLVEFIGEIGESQKSDFLGQARALLFPIDWPEPFGLVMIEALACGVPVVAFRGGSVPEIIEHGVTGYIVDSMEEAIEATRALSRLDRRACRAAFERRFSASRMAAQYVQLYSRLASSTSNLVA